MNDLKLLQSARAEPRTSVSPKLFRGVNLLLTPLPGLAHVCQSIAGDNIFVTFSPPENFLSRIEGNEDFYENIANLPSIDEALYPQICSCPGYAAVSALAPAYFWSSLLGPDGYLNCTPEQAASLAGLSVDETKNFLEKLKNYVEPPGLFASGLSESLAIQLRRLGLEGGVAWQIITDGQDALVSGKIIKWGKLRGIGEDEMLTAMCQLRALDPTPGKNFSRTHFVAADVEFLIENEEVKPRLLTQNLPVIDVHFEEFGLSPDYLPKEIWMRGEWRAAKRALKLFELRCRTVTRIALYIAAAQREKILDFSKPPKPMTYAVAAKALSMHASTLHRCAHNTYCLINGKSFPLSLFFSRSAAANKKFSVAELRVLIAELRARGLTNNAIGKRLGLPERTVAYHSAKITRAAISAKF